MANEIVVELDETNDFGFSFHDEEEIVTSSGARRCQRR